VLVNGDDKCDSKSESPLSWNENQASTRWYRDHDADGYGDWYSFVDSPAQPTGYVSDNSDCNDNRADTNPGQTSDPGPGDRNCNGIEAEDQSITWYRDADNDGFGATAQTVRAPMDHRPAGYAYRYGDCNDHNDKIVPYHGNCYTTRANSPGAGGPYDIDGDGHRVIGAPGSDAADDCNDNDRHEFPGNPELRDTVGHDEDCDEVTGIVLRFDPLFLDPRPHSIPIDFQLRFDNRGQLRNGHGTVGVGSTAGVPGVYPTNDLCLRFSVCAVWATPPNYL
jgi:hypothetical protein